MYDCGTCLAKYVVCGFNFIIFLAGSGVLAVGIWLIVDKTSFIGLSKIVPSEQVQNFTQPGVIEQVSYVLLAIGALMFIVSFLGYCGALRESQCMLTTYGILLLVILILEITVGCLAIIYKSQTENETKDILKYSLAKYYTKTENGDAITLAWDTLQMSLHCCGVDNYTDYLKNEEWVNGGRLVPASCCVLDENKKPLASTCMTAPSEANSYYMKGCFKAVIDWLRAHLDIIILVAIGLGIIELVGICLAFCLSKSINQRQRFK